MTSVSHTMLSQWTSCMNLAYCDVCIMSCFWQQILNYFSRNERQQISLEHKYSDCILISCLKSHVHFYFLEMAHIFSRFTAHSGFFLYFNPLFCFIISIFYIRQNAMTSNLSNTDEFEYFQCVSIVNVSMLINIFSFGI